VSGITKIVGDLSPLWDVDNGYEVTVESKVVDKEKWFSSNKVG
jgi:hypothetical protein